ncbi:hypothetical protein [Paraburkholderia rhizosphaerae]|uniref:hypothetical protein n=1 Tax=Paraburkholderia rhizosphaerae TaxID=480658 RepID=UPI0010668493|nr:hypothetical protein [Paraburkholderia rhizosphaerae]
MLEAVAQWSCLNKIDVFNGRDETRRETMRTGDEAVMKGRNDSERDGHSQRERGRAFNAQTSVRACAARAGTAMMSGQPSDAIRKERLSAFIARFERPALSPGYGGHAVRCVSGNVSRGNVSIKACKRCVSFYRQRALRLRKRLVKPHRIVRVQRGMRVVYPLADIKSAKERGPHRDQQR